MLLDGDVRPKEYGHVTFKDDTASLAESISKYSIAQHVPDKYRALSETIGRKPHPFRKFNAIVKLLTTPMKPVSLSAYIHPSDNQRYSLVLLDLRGALPNGDTQVWTYTLHWLQHQDHHYHFLAEAIDADDGTINPVFPVNERTKCKSSGMKGYTRGICISFDHQVESNQRYGIVCSPSDPNTGLRGFNDYFNNCVEIHSAEQSLNMMQFAYSKNQ